jgi:hypothetical protein
VDGRAWIDGLPPELARQADLLRALLDAVERDERFRAVEVGCSLGRGNADALSDVDVGLWIADDGWDEALAAVESLMNGLGSAVDAFAVDRPWGRWFFVEYDDGAQLDLAAQRASAAKGRMADTVALLDREGLLAEPYEPSSYRADENALREWNFDAWFALANLDKYLRRGSLWEARASLEAARASLLSLHAAAHDVPSPVFGLTSVLDTNVPLPHGLEQTLAGLDAVEIRRAALALADLLEEHDPPPRAARIRARLRAPNAK